MKSLCSVPWFGSQAVPDDDVTSAEVSMRVKISS
jgi:hypothetical protein